MKYLAIDTSGDLVVILFDGEKYYTEYLKGCNTKHSLTLMPYVEQCLINSGLKLEDLDFLSVVTGPGSFTGIRIGIATIKALAFATGKKIMPLTSFQVLAYTDNAPDKACLLVDANHDNYYVGIFDDKKQVMPPCFMNIGEIDKLLGERVAVCERVIDGLKGESMIADRVSGIKNAILNNASELVSSNEVYPLYVKKSQEEEELC